MPDPQALSVTVPEKVLSSIIEAQVVAALGNKDEVMRGIVQAVLARKVRPDGQESTSSYENNTPMLQALCSRYVREATEAAIKSWLEKNRAKFEAEVQKALTAGSKDIASQLVAGFTLGASRHNNGFVVTVTSQQGTDR